MAKKQIDNVRELIYWSYANLGMAHAALVRKQLKYAKLDYIIRARLFHGLKNSRLNVRSIFDDEKIKLQTGQVCNYCGSSERLALDHIFPKRYGGIDEAENLVYACTRCNSSKGKKDLMEWMNSSGSHLPILVIRRYLKLTLTYCIKHDLIDKSVDELRELELPFKIELLPVKFPQPKYLKLSADKVTEIL